MIDSLYQDNKETMRAILRGERKKDLVEEILELQESMDSYRKRVCNLIEENDRLTSTYEPYEPPKPPRTRLRDHCLTFSLDLWPIRDWFRFGYKGYNPGKYSQLTIGPLRIDYFVG